MKMEKKQLSNRFKTFAERECAGSSELYEYLAMKIADDDDMLELSSYTREGQPIPNLFFGAVHYLLLQGKEHTVSSFYPSIVDKPKALKESFPYFKDFCLTYRESIIPILREEMVQTNEVRRCGYLYPCFSHIYHKAKKPLALIEIGTSAGFQLLWDKYSYSYNTGEMYGDDKSAVHIQSKIIGENRPTFPKVSPPVTYRYGLDLHINDLSNSEDALWLNALIWPEHTERRALFRQASACVSRNREELHLIEGDGIELLPRIMEKIPNDSAICVFHTHVANQIPVDRKRLLLEHVKRFGSKRDVFHLYNNIWDSDLHLDSFVKGMEYNKVIAQTDGHGRWFRWKP